jgi:hypothetical protein
MDGQLPRGGRMELTIAGVANPTQLVAVVPAVASR